MKTQEKCLNSGIQVHEQQQQQQPFVAVQKSFKSKDDLFNNREDACD